MMNFLFLILFSWNFFWSLIKYRGSGRPINYGSSGFGTPRKTLQQRRTYFFGCRKSLNSRLRLIFCPRSVLPFFVCIHFISFIDFSCVGLHTFNFANLGAVYFNYFSHTGEGVSVGGRDSPIPGPGSGPSDRCNFNIQVRYRNGLHPCLSTGTEEEKRSCLETSGTGEKTGCDRIHNPSSVR